MNSSFLIYRAFTFSRGKRTSDENQHGAPGEMRLWVKRKDRSGSVDPLSQFCLWSSFPITSVVFDAADGYIVGSSQPD